MSKILSVKANYFGKQFIKCGIDSDRLKAFYQSCYENFITHKYIKKRVNICQ